MPACTSDVESTRCKFGSRTTTRQSRLMGKRTTGPQDQALGVKHCALCVPVPQHNYGNAEFCLPKSGRGHPGEEQPCGPACAPLHSTSITTLPNVALPSSRRCASAIFVSGNTESIMTCTL